MFEGATSHESSQNSYIMYRRGGRLADRQYVPYASHALGRVEGKIDDFVLFIPQVSLGPTRFRRSSIRKLSRNPLLCPGAVAVR
jgi:hypothetical protein